MLPPTLATLASLARIRHGGRGVGVRRRRTIEPIRPRIRRGADDGYVAELPDGTSFVLPELVPQDDPGVREVRR